MKPSRCLACFIALLSLVPIVGAAEPVTIRLGTLLPSGTAQHALLLELGERWRKETNGGVRLVLYPDGRLGGEAEMVKKIRIRQLNAGLFSVVGLSDIDEGVTGLQLMPLMFRSWAEVDFVREKMRPLLESRLRAQGYEVLFWADAGWVRFFTKAPAIRPDDFRPMKMFAWVGSEPQIELMRSIGCRPVPLETTDILLGLNTDLVNAVPMPPLVALASQVYGPAPHMLEMNWCPIVGAAVVRLDTWEKTPAGDRPKIHAAAEAIGERFRERSRLENEESVRVMRERGLHTHALTAPAEAEWRDLTAQLYPKIRGSLVPADIFDAVEQHLRAFRAGTSAAAVHP